MNTHSSSNLKKGILNLTLKNLRRISVKPLPPLSHRDLTSFHFWTRSKHKKIAVEPSRGIKTETFTNRLRVTVMALIISARSSLEDDGTDNSGASAYLPVEVIEKISMELSWFCIHLSRIGGGMMLVEHQDGDSQIEVY